MFIARGSVRLTEDVVCRWRQNTNPVRTKWNVHNIPTVVRYQRVDGKIQETGRLVEGEILNERKLGALIKGQ